MKTKKQFNRYTLSMLSILILFCGIAQAVQWKTICYKSISNVYGSEITIIVGNTIRNNGDIKKVEFSLNNNSPTEIVALEPDPSLTAGQNHHDDPTGYKYTGLKKIVGKMKDISNTHWEMTYKSSSARRVDYYDESLSVWKVNYFSYGEKLTDNGAKPKIKDPDISGYYQCRAWVQCSSCSIS
ncbi:MAG: hypothetical protein K0R14_462 [Burkholderiales bacterium]|jgi:hypothetical protein|nr:hypothetical protein [Burkholderiales bacterium]